MREFWRRAQGAFDPDAARFRPGERVAVWASNIPEWLLLEFGTLSKLTGKPVYYDKAKRALVETFKRRSRIGLVGAAINVETGQWTSTDASVASGTDSYYEYLLKCWKLFGDEDCLAMWKASISAINRYLADEVDGDLWYGHADMNTGKRTDSSLASRRRRMRTCAP